MTDDSRQKFSRRELRNLWASGFAGDEDEVEKLAGFADCRVEQAEAMIESFRKTTAAQKAAEAEANRMKKQQPRKKKDPAPDEGGEITEVSEPFPATDVIAAAVNAGHKLSVVEASGMAFGRRKSVIIEKIGHRGEFYHRLKVTTYAFYKTKEEAVAAARKHKLKLTLFDDPQ